MTNASTNWFDRTFTALTNRDFRVLWLGSMVTFVAFFMSTVAQGVVAFDLTGRNTAVGTVVFFQGVAQLVTNPIGGAYADRLDKKKIIFACQAVSGAVFLSIGILVATGLIGIAFLSAGSFIVGMSFSFNGPARQAYVASIVDNERCGNAVALNQVALNASRMVGPLLGSALIAWSLLGTDGTYFVLASMYAIALVLILMLPSSAPRTGEGGVSIFGDIWAGVRYLGGNPQLRALLMFFVPVMMLGFPYITVLPGFAENALGESTSSIGLLLFATAAGGLVASIFVAGLADSPKAHIVFQVAGVIFGLGLIATGLMPNLWLAMAAMFVAGIGTGGFQTLNGALILRGTSPAYFGRVMSLTMLAFAGYGLIALPVGFIADTYGERATLVGMGTIVASVVVVLSPLFGRTLGDPAVSSGQD